MIGDSGITVTFDKKELLERVVDKLADLPLDSTPADTIVIPDWMIMTTKSVSTSLVGVIAFNHLVGTNSFQTKFIFTCVQLRKDIFTIGWSVSLS